MVIENNSSKGKNGSSLFRKKYGIGFRHLEIEGDNKTSKLEAAEEGILPVHIMIPKGGLSLE